MTGVCLQNLFAVLFSQRFQPLQLKRTQQKDVLFECSYSIANIRTFFYMCHHDRALWSLITTAIFFFTFNTLKYSYTIFTTIQDISIIRHETVHRLMLKSSRLRHLLRFPKLLSTVSTCLILHILLQVILKFIRSFIK